MIKLAIFIIITLLITGCANKNPYKIYKPKVRYKPSVKALDKLNHRALGKRYIWGEERAYKGFDCSGLTYYNFGSMGIDIPRVADQQYRSGTPVSLSELQKGDLLFFATNRHKPWKATHVGIYLGDGKFEHASSAKKRVIVSSINSKYYKSHFIGARRYYNFNDYQPQCTTPTPTVPKIEYARNRQNSNEAISLMQSRPQNSTSSSTVPTTVFSQAQESISTQSEASKYYIYLNSQAEDKSSLLTKLELSGLRADMRNNSIVIGPFDSKIEAIETKGRNIQLLADSEIREN